MALATAAVNYRRVGPGKFYLVATPSTATTEEDYYALFFTVPATKTVAGHKTGIKPYITQDETGLDVKVKMSKTAFKPCTGTTTDMVTGIDTATATITAYDVTPDHLVDMFGSQGADLISVAAATGVAARQIALLGPQSYNTLYTAMYEIPSSVVPGEYFHYIFPCVSVVTDLELKMNKKDPMTLKMEFQLQTSPFLLNAAGNGVVIITDDPTTPSL